MNIFYSHSIPLKDVLNDLAVEFDTTLQQNCDEYILTIPAAIGQGKITGIDFKEGLGILIYDCTFLLDCEIHFIIGNVHPLKFLFCEEGKLEHRFENETTLHTLDLMENSIVASAQLNGHVIKFCAGVKTVIHSLEMDRTEFQINHDCELLSLDNTLETLFRDTTATQAFHYHGNYCVKMANLFKEIDEFDEKEFLRHLFLEGSAYKILTLQLMQYLDDGISAIHRSVLRKFELILVHEAVAFIDNEIMDYISVKKLAAVVGLNTNKLQSGFKLIHDNTVNEYVHNRRLDLGSNMLKNSEMTISEIVYKLGLTSRSYFSKIFKTKYGITPTVYRSNGNIAFQNT